MLSKKTIFLNKKQNHFFSIKHIFLIFYFKERKTVLKKQLLN